MYYWKDGLQAPLGSERLIGGFCLSSQGINGRPAYMFISKARLYIRTTNWALDGGSPMSHVEMAMSPVSIYALSMSILK